MFESQVIQASGVHKEPEKEIIKQIQQRITDLIGKTQATIGEREVGRMVATKASSAEHVFGSILSTLSFSLKDRAAVSQNKKFPDILAKLQKKGMDYDLEGLLQLTPEEIQKIISDLIERITTAFGHEGRQAIERLWDERGKGIAESLPRNADGTVWNPFKKV